MIRALEVSSSALVAQRIRLDVVAGNIANAFSTQRDDGVNEPFRRRGVTFESGDATGRGAGVHVAEVFEDPSDYRLEYDPGHPHAIQEGPQAGYVRYPNVDLTMEYVDAVEASRAYEANVAVLNVTRTMLNQSIELFA
jgi:flagellar basal-body rod protein FlgC